MHTAIHSSANQQVQRAARGLLSLTHPNKELFYRQRALLRRAVPAGFPSPADVNVEQYFSLDEHLIQHCESTFSMLVAGN
jgi:DNA polymerase V